MHVSVEISLYPLTADYEPPIVAFIQRLPREGITVATNPLSTQLSGEYDTVMAALTEAMRPTLDMKGSCSFVLKILNVAIEPGKNLEF
ncbi:YkoF family thiamine/hydroxymethylpyrimidine-binding protein [Lewinella sp. IMCC34183]|uniref:YkoF family thiamine/hydroxymethylpyrimidine-binding protein n=1 Tax=Lewinella sp. IMCC34183 TaxID=2248762 RepID=UPI000E27485F|nr:YkoF family thiamine/hydroxymethylpyrimidine-binding protein [Lewinella sp. IMCC34183]